MLAKPEYFSPPDEVCCWPGRCGGVVAGLGAVAESHRESAAAWGAVAKQLLAGNRRHRGLPAEALKRSSMGKSLLLRRRRCGCIGKSLPLHGRRYSSIGKPTSAHKKRRARKRPKYLSRAASIYCLAKGQHAMRRGRTAVHRLHAVQAKLPLAFTIGIHRRRSAGEVAAAIMQGLQGRLQQMQELRRALGIRQG